MTENKNGEKNNKPNQTTKIILVVMIVLIVSLLSRCAVSCHNREIANDMKEVLTEFEENVDAITQIDKAARQEAVNTAVEEGMMNVNYSANTVFKGKISQSFNVKNIENNHGPIRFELYDEDGDCIYASKKIAPGYEINKIELTKELSKGEHECTIKVQYAEEGMVASVFPIWIEVE